MIVVRNYNLEYARNFCKSGYFMGKYINRQSMKGAIHKPDTHIKSAQCG